QNPFLVHHTQYGGASQLHGNGAWADYPWYGTEKFWFIEDNTFLRATGVVRSAVDGAAGNRYVFRHNYSVNSVVTDHGTEGGAERGARAHEVYDNTFNFVNSSVAGMRSGTTLFHDNSFTGAPSGTPNCCNLPNNRETALRPFPVWGIADGTSSWDAKDTDGNGHFVEG